MTSPNLPAGSPQNRRAFGLKRGSRDRVGRTRTLLGCDLQAILDDAPRADGTPAADDVAARRWNVSSATVPSWGSRPEGRCAHFTLATVTFNPATLRMVQSGRRCWQSCDASGDSCFFCLHRGGCAGMQVCSGGALAHSFWSRETVSEVARTMDTSRFESGF